MEKLKILYNSQLRSCIIKLFKKEDLYFINQKKRQTMFYVAPYYHDSHSFSLSKQVYSRTDLIISKRNKINLNISAIC